jgi:KDO2-lipid IV(A) lauroyltransferase
LAALTYYLALPFIYLFSLLPFPVLYLFSDFFFLLLYHGIGYRKQVVITNLRNAFPEKSEPEIAAVARKYYRYLCDLFLETFKTLTISKRKMLQRCALTPEASALFAQLAREQKSIVLVMGHLGNWEWAGNTFSLVNSQQLYVIYHPISNKYFNGLMYRMRTRFGTKLIAMKDTFREMRSRKDEVNATAFIADQTPRPDNAYWTTFLNQETPVFKGTEIIARKINYPVVYASVQRRKRGYYDIHAEMLVANPAEMPENAISEQHTRRLEKDIIAQPETWLWSHRRWKHKKP